MPVLTATLDSLGLSDEARAGYERLLADAEAMQDAAGIPRDGRRAWIVPGRIEVLGKHVDYAGGRSLLCAVERGMVVVARKRHDRQVLIRDAVRRDALAILVDVVGTPTPARPTWSVYPRTVVRRLVRNFGDAVGGADITVASNLPSSAGVSSSSALVVGLTLALARLWRLYAQPRWQAALPDRVALAGYLGAMENGLDFGVLEGERGVGTLGGAQDQTAILCSEAGRLVRFAWAPVRAEGSVPWPADHAFAIGVSGVVATKTGAVRERYNRAARTAHHLVAAWNAERAALGADGAPAGTLAAAVREARRLAGDAEDADTVPAPLAEAARRLSTDEFPATHLEARLRQFCEETWRWVPGAAAALAARDVAAFGACAAGSQEGAERALENQVPETMALVRLARELGAPAASAFGAGFGGSVWAMIPRDDAAGFLARWKQQYQRRHPGPAPRSQFLVTQPVDGARALADPKGEPDD